MAKEVSESMLHPRKSTPKKKRETKSKDVKTGSLGIGDVYAYGVKDMVQKMKDEQGSSQTSWLGVPKQTLNADEYTDRQKLKLKGKE
jgi:hypothetical protein